jgi:hypothetical protein
MKFSNSGRGIRVQAQRFISGETRGIVLSEPTARYTTMTPRRRTSLLLASLLSSLCLSAPSLAQSTKPAPSTRKATGSSILPADRKTKPDDKSAHDAPNPIPAAARELLKEFDDAQGPNRTLTRKTSDYFAKADERPTVDQVFKALDQRFGRDARADAYVKWQLLSAVPVTTDEKQVLRLAQAFKKSTPPQPNPLLDPRQRSQIEQLASRVRPGSDADPDLALRELGDKYFDANRPLIGYRDELLQRMPVSAGKLQLLWEELALRTKLGIDVGKQRDDALDATREWSKAASPAEITAISQILTRVRGAASDDILRRYKPDKRDWDRWPMRLEYEDRIQKLSNELNQRARGAR